MTADEIQAAIARAEEKRQELLAQQPAAKQSARMFSMLPKAADLYCRQIALGLDGDPRAALKARVFLREWFGGKIRLEPLPDGGLMAHWNENSVALLRALGSCGSGGTPSRNFDLPQVAVPGLRRRVAALAAVQVGV